MAGSYFRSFCAYLIVGAIASLLVGDVTPLFICVAAAVTVLWFAQRFLE